MRISSAVICAPCAPRAEPAAPAVSGGALRLRAPTGKYSAEQAALVLVDCWDRIIVESFQERAERICETTDPPGIGGVAVGRHDGSSRTVAAGGRESLASFGRRTRRTRKRRSN